MSRPGARRTLATIAVALAILSVVAALVPPGALSRGSPAVPTGIPLRADSGSLPASRAGIHGAVSSGPGTFFTNAPLPLPTSPTCFRGSSVSAGACANVTNEPSINYTSKGVLAVAYTALTNSSPCANLTGVTSSEIGFVRSTDLGATWSTPYYLGDSTCSDGPKFASAWEPSLTSLANGTLALVFIEYNVSQPQYYPAYVPYSFETNTPSSRLVFTESYDGGGNWTTPVALNTSVVDPTGNLMNWAPERPWISANGSTIFVTWENLTRSSLYPQTYYPNWGGAPSIGSHLLVSKNGGAAWGSTIDLPVTPGRYFPFTTQVAMNPTVLAVPNGTVYVSFTTNVSNSLPCATICLQNPTITGDVVVGASTDDGATFHWSTVGRTLPVSTLWGPFEDPSPQLASNPTNGQLYITFSAGLPGVFCYPGPFGGCYAGTGGVGVYFANSSNGAHSWSAAHLVDTSLVDPHDGLANVNYNPSLVVDSKGVVHVQMTYSQLEECGVYCVLQKQLYYNSSDNGTTFTGGLVLSGNYTYNPYQWDGEYDTMATAGGHLWIAYVQDICPAWTTQSCAMYSSTSGRAQVTIAQPFHGTGITLTFSSRGLPSGASWTVNVLGNLRTGVQGSTINVTGVPTGQPINWSLPWSNVSYGTAYVGVVAAGTSYTFTSSTSITVNYGEQVRVEVSTLPVLNPCYYNQCLNWNLPTLGVSWVAVGTSVSVSVSNTTVSCATGCNYLNASFLGWVGWGNGSVTSGAYSITFTANGPVNETANFGPNAVCNGYGTYLYCMGGATYGITFHQSGLPSGVAWSVSADGVTGTSTNGTLSLELPSGTVAWTAWSVPSGTSKVWVANSTSASIVQLPYTTVVNLTFTQATLSGQRFPVAFNAVGLPTGTHWTVNLSGALTTFTQPNGSATLAAGGYNLSFAPIYGQNGTRYSVAGFEVVPYVMNLSSANTTGASGRLAVGGPASVTAVYAENVRVAVQAGTGGNASASQTWVTPGFGVTLHETASAGYVFAGWSGYGPGATSGAQDTQSSPTIYPSGPVTEIATFVHPTPARYSVVVRTSGLPAQQTFTVSLGALSATSAGSSATVTGLNATWYPLVVPTVLSNASEGIQYRFSAASATGGVVAFGNGTVQVTGNGTLTLVFASVFAVTTASVGPGTVSTGNSTVWVSDGTTFSASAQPGTGDRFLGWSGSGAGAYSGPQLTISVPVTGPITEVATFAPPPPPRTFNLTLTQASLPSGTPWAFALGSTGAAGSGGSITLAGLNGSYVLNVPWVAGAIDGTRWVANLTANQSVTIAADRSVSVTFTEQFRLTVAATAGGSVTHAGAGWYARGASVTLVATPATGQTFAGWTGTGSSAYTGANASAMLTVGGPTSEVASFAPTPVSTPSKGTNGKSYAGPPVALAIFAALLVVGAVAMALLGRRRPPAVGESSPPAESEPEGSPTETVYGGPEPTPEPE